jgi:hypothetical protein
MESLDLNGEALLRKLQVKPGARMRVIGAPAGIEAALTGRVALTAQGRPCDAALAFCHGPDDVARFAPLAMAALAADGPLWFAYRKGAAAKRSGLNRDVGWAPLGAVGYRVVRAIAFDGEWSGLRFRETWRVKTADQ